MTSGLRRVVMLGLGRMGRPMAGHLAAAGYAIVGFDISAPARADAVGHGLPVVETAAEAAATGPELVCSSLPATADVEAAYLGGDGIVPMLAPGTVCADLSTIDVAASRRLATRCAEAGVVFLDTPVSGTSIHAEAGTLVVMAGGDDSAFARVRPALTSFASRVERVGGNGAGLELKLITNRLLTTHLAAIGEAVVALERTGLSVTQALDLLRAGAVPRLLDYKGDAVVNRDYTPQFTVDLMAKDLRLAAEALARTPLATAATEIVEATVAAGHGSDDLAAIMEVIAARVDPPVDPRPEGG